MRTLRPLAEKFVFAEMIIYGMLCCTSPLFAAYSKGSAPTGTLKYEAFDPPATTRTTIGINEVVDCSIIDWVDWDTISPPPPEGDPNIQDNIGQVTWTCGKGTVFPTVSSWTLYSAPASDTDTNDTLYAQILDSRQLGLDDEITKEVTFTIKVPNGYKPTFNFAIPGIPGPPFVRIGGQADFAVQILPDNVNFINVEFRENIPGDNFTWPDGTSNNFPAIIVDFFVVDDDINGKSNTAHDLSSTALDPKIRLLKNGNYEGITFNIRVPLQFYGSSGWVNFESSKIHPKVYTSDLKCTLKIQAAGGNAESPPQGPWF
jgi:hypothetical protein